jgi:hypothetical protein
MVHSAPDWKSITSVKHKTMMELTREDRLISSSSENNTQIYEEAGFKDRK